MALFFADPCCLDLVTYNNFRKRFGRGQLDLIPEERFLLTLPTEDDEFSTASTIKVAYRPLSADYFAELDNSLTLFEPHTIPFTDNLVYQPHIASGVNSDILKKNLIILFSASKLKVEEMFPDAPDPVAIENLTNSFSVLKLSISFFYAITYSRRYGLGCMRLVPQMNM